MTAIIFGANGQDGYYLAASLRREAVEVIGVSRRGDWLRGDVGDAAFVERLIAEKKPDYIFHLAANSTPAHEVWLENHRTISDGALYILEAAKLHSPQSRVFLSGSGLQFENRNLPIRETDAFNAGSPYAVSRIHTTYAARYYRTLGLKAYTGFFFNHESPLRTERHMSRKIAAFAQRIQRGESATLEIGDISVEKEWTFAGDSVAAVWALVNQDAIFECNIGSGLGYSIQDWLEVCFEIAGKDWRSYVRPLDAFTPQYKRLVSDASRLQALGWKPQTSFRELAQMMMEHD